MTTIAADRYCMAGDTLCDYSGLKTKCRKIFKKSGDIIGTAGDSQDGMVFINWYGTGEEPPEMGDDFEALVLTIDHKLYWYGHRCAAEEILEPFFSIGAGSHIAIAYMSCGANPVQAVEAACEKTIGSGPPVDMLRL